MRRAPLHDRTAPGGNARGSRAESIDRRLAGFAGARGAIRRRVAAISGRVVETRAWERLGFARASDYARERLGLSGRSLHDLARVDAALQSLPGIEGALVEGRIGWTKARLLARVAAPESERWWLARAARLTADALSLEVRRIAVGSVEAGAGAIDGRGEIDGSSRIDRAGAIDGMGAIDRRGEIEGRGAIDSTGAIDGTGSEEEPWEGVSVRCSRAAASLWHFARQRARWVEGASLPSWACAERIAAEVLSSIPIDDPPPPVVPRVRPVRVPRIRWHPPPAARSTDPARSTEPARPAPSTGQARAPQGSALATPEPEGPGTTATENFPPWSEAPSADDVRRWLRALESADPFSLDTWLRDALRVEQEIDARIGPLLCEVADRRLHRALGFDRLDDYVRERLGMSPQKGRAIVRLERMGPPSLLDAYRAGHLTRIQASTLLPVLVDTPAPRIRSWVEHAKRVTVRRLRDDVEAALTLREVNPQEFERSAGLPGPGTGLAVPGAGADPREKRQTRALASGPEETARIFFVGPASVVRLFRAVVCTVQRRIDGTPGQALAAMCAHAVEAWGGESPRVPAAHRVFDRDGWRCTVPGCSSRRNLHDHHVVFRSAGGSDDPENRTTLCAWHHLRGVHAGIVRVTGKAPGRLRFELGLRPGRRPLVVYRSGS